MTKRTLMEERIRERMASMPDPMEARENAGEGEMPDPRDALAGGPAGRRVPWPRPWRADAAETPEELAGLELAAAYLVDLLLLRAGGADGETLEALGFFGSEWLAAKALVRRLGAPGARASKGSPWPFAPMDPESREEAALRKSWEESAARGESARCGLAEGAPLVPWPVDPDGPETPSALQGLEWAVARAMNDMLAMGRFPTPPAILEALEAVGAEHEAAKIRIHSLEGLRDGMGAAMAAFAEAKSMLPDVVEHLRKTDQVDVLPHAENSLYELSVGMDALAAAGMSGNPWKRLEAAIDGLESAEMRRAFKAMLLDFAEGRRGGSGPGSEGGA